MKRKRKFGWLPVALGLLVFAATAVWMVRAVGQTAEASTGRAFAWRSRRYAGRR